MGEQWMASWSVLFLGLADWIRERPEDATARLREALSVKWLLGDLVGSANAIEILGWAALGRNDPAAAARLLGGSRQLFEPLGLHLLGFTRLKGWSDACAAETEHALGTAKFRKEFEAGRSMSTDGLIAFALGKAPAATPAREEGTPLPPTSRESEICQPHRTGQDQPRHRRRAGHLATDCRRSRRTHSGETRRDPPRAARRARHQRQRA
jgi:hypothetical protein